MQNHNLNLLKALCKIDNKTLHIKLLKKLIEIYGKSNVVSTPMYIIAKGNIPVCLVAHLDTVFDDKWDATNKEFYYDEQQNILWSPQGLGTDDRAGVYAILQLLDKGYKPHIIFTQDEEVGCLGADTLVRRYSKCPWKKLKYILQLDRRGEKDCVFYNCDNPDFEEYISSFGFETAWGTYSDISVIAPEWKIAAANLSVGYIDEHSYTERCNLQYLDATIDKVECMLKDADKAKKYKYIERKYNYIHFANPNNDNKCILCGGDMDKDAQFGCICSACSKDW